MKPRRIWFLAILVGLLLARVDLSLAAVPGAPVAAAKGVIQRLIGERAKAFTLEIIPRENGKDLFEVESSKGKVTIRGTDAVALTRGFYHYLRHACNSQVTWSGMHVDLPKTLPGMSPTRVVSPYEFRQYFNVCTFGYTTVWWDWKRWEREIDWMALHGVNMPLAMAGQEAIWQKVWRSMGITDKELDEYFTGPAFLPWHRMGNINSHGGPLPQGWIDSQVELQKKILVRMRELGMKPIVPAFSGFVPKAFSRIHPDANVYAVAPWSGFPERDQSFLLSPTSPLFTQIGKEFMQEYAKVFGPARYYLADSFNELQVPVSKEHRYDELAEFGKAVYDAIKAGNPDGVWVMQGWLFYNDSQFWDKASAKALLSKVPDDRMMILDLSNERFHGWKAQDAFYGKQWVYSIIHNFGGNNPLNGPLAFIADDPAEALNSPKRGNLVGFGMAPEGIENNEVVYELLTDVAWSSRPINIERWLREYAEARYGDCPPAMEEAGALLLSTAYSGGAMNIRHGFQDRPSLAPQGNVNNSPDYAWAVQRFLSCADQLRGSALYVNDAIEMTAQLVGTVIDARLRDAGKAHRDGPPALRDTLFAEALDLMRDMDALIAARPDMRLERWIHDARTWAVKPGEADFYEENARRQITIWGGPWLHEYASKVWSGLIRDFYAGRWEFFERRLKKLKPGEEVSDSEFIAWEEGWIRSTKLSEARPVADPLLEAKALVAKINRLTRIAPQPDILPALEYYEKGSSAQISISVSAPCEIRYTLDGSEPTAASALYRSPLPLTGPVTVKARSFKEGCVPSFISTKDYKEVLGGVNGLVCKYYEGTWHMLPDFDTLAALRTTVAYDFAIEPHKTREDGWGLTFAGYLQITAEGRYTFTTVSDDGSKLFIDGKEIVNNDGSHEPRAESGSVNLTAGRHAITVQYYEDQLGEVLKVMYEGPGIPKQAIPSSSLFLHEKE